MYAEWTAHLQDPEAKEKFVKQIYAAKPVLDRLKEVTDRKLYSLDRQEMNIEVYNMPNWDHRQAHKNGQRSSLDWMKNLVDLDQQKKDQNYEPGHAPTDFFKRTDGTDVRGQQELPRTIDRTGREIPRS